MFLGKAVCIYQGHGLIAGWRSSEAYTGESLGSKSRRGGRSAVQRPKIQISEVIRPTESLCTIVQAIRVGNGFPR